MGLPRGDGPLDALVKRVGWRMERDPALPEGSGRRLVWDAAGQARGRMGDGELRATLRREGLATMWECAVCAGLHYSAPDHAVELVRGVGGGEACSLMLPPIRRVGNVLDVWFAGAAPVPRGVVAQNT